MAGSREQDEKKGSKTGLLLVLLIGLVALSAWNYQRNASLEQSAPPSPYASIATADLDVLIAAYQSEIDALRARGGTGLRARARDTHGVENGAREFERVQRSMRSTREAGYEIAEREGMIAAIEQERSRRASSEAGGKWMILLRRAFTVSL